MAVLPVRRFLDPVLTQRALAVESIGAFERQLAQDLLETMAASPGCVGLAANQVGVALRAFVLDVTGHRSADSCHGEFVLFNPVLISATGESMAREGCMSVPDLTGNVRRSEIVVVKGLDIDGRKRVIEANAFEARAVLHELDHLDGMLFVHRVDSMGHDLFPRKKYK